VDTFWQSFVKRFALCYRTVVLSVCDVVGMWPNGWMDQDETWHAGRPRSRPHWVDPAPRPPKGDSPQFSAHICCGQMAGWIKMPHGMEVGLGPGNFVLDGDDPAPPPQKGAKPPIFGPCLLWPNGWMDQDGTWHGDGPRFRPHCDRWGPSSLPLKVLC